MKKMRAIATLLLASVIATSAIFTQSLKLSGEVIDSVSKAPLEYVTISLGNSSTSTASNKEGNFILIVDAPHRGDSIRFTHAGLETKTIALSRSIHPQGHAVFTPNPVSTVIE